MTEIERIIEKGIVTEGFLKEEIIDGCKVKTELKKIWAVLLDLLFEFDRVCKKYDLKYWLAAGSMIGAVRHHGFIPWDDDLDVFMMRADCDKLLEVAGKEFTHPYFLQTPYTDEGYFYSFTKLRNSNTTGMSKAHINEPFNQGLFLDIFTLDSCNLSEAESQYNTLKELILANSTYMRRNDKDIDETVIERRKKYLTPDFDPLKTYQEIERVCRQFNDEKNSEKVVISANCMASYDKHIYDRTDFSSSIYVDFCGLKVPIPVGYHKILTKRYGDYMKKPEIFERIGHDSCIMDSEKSYTEYLTRSELI